MKTSATRRGLALADLQHRLVAVLALLVAGASCTPDQTALMVTLEIADPNAHPTALAVTLTVADLELGMQTTVAVPDGGAIKNLDSFAVYLPDRLDGQEVTVTVTTSDLTIALTGSGKATARLHQVVPLTVELGVAARDLAMDQSSMSPDLAILDAGVPDATMDTRPDDGDGASPDASDALADLPTPDLGDLPDQSSLPDLTALLDLTNLPDLRCVPGATTCAAGIESTCQPNGSMTTRNCPYACAGNVCLKPDHCMSPPADVSAGGTFSDTTAGYGDDAQGSCWVNTPGLDAVTSFNVNAWRTVMLDTVGSTIDTVLYTRLSCSDPTSEMPLAGPCTINGIAAENSSVGTACSDNLRALANGASRLVLCNLPPLPMGGNYYTWVDGKDLAGGPYKLNVTLGPVATLNDCAGAGNLLDADQRTFSGTTVGHKSSFFNTVANNQNQCGGDRGNGAADAVFFFHSVAGGRNLVITTTATFKHIVYVRPACNQQDVICVPSGPGNVTSVTVPNLNSNALYFIVVDGQGSAPNDTKGTFTINVHP